MGGVGGLAALRAMISPVAVISVSEVSSWNTKCTAEMLARPMERYTESSAGQHTPVGVDEAATREAVSSLGTSSTPTSETSKRKLCALA